MATASDLGAADIFTSKGHGTVVTRQISPSTLIAGEGPTQPVGVQGIQRDRATNSVAG
ncbi:hypothetical protein [Chloroflexus sp.]|uniref:hypothetical protein n=1 Tax=Chloroflexus sp. TaxID=1904827 RepID=UPI002ACE061F|nr:hypothetical protein [Chloroflexus sp.]